MSKLISNIQAELKDSSEPQVSLIKGLSERQMNEFLGKMPAKNYSIINTKNDSCDCGNEWDSITRPGVAVQKSPRNMCLSLISCSLSYYFKSLTGLCRHYCSMEKFSEFTYFYYDSNYWNLCNDRVNILLLDALWWYKNFHNWLNFFGFFNFFHLKFFTSIKGRNRGERKCVWEMVLSMTKFISN